MNKDAYYFPHFSNARHDRKLRRMRKELGLEGYGIYFMTLEVLREQEDFAYPLSDLDLLADDFGTSEAKMEAVVCAYDLFKIDDDKFFYSPKLIEYLQPYLERSKRARKAALKRWNGDSDANALPKQSKSNASKVKYSKVNESKGSITDSDVEVLSESIYEFELFWDDYDKKVDRTKCEKKWGGISESEKEVIKEFVPIYVRSTPEKKYRKNPLSFLNAKTWNDDWSEYQPKAKNHDQFIDKLFKN